MTARRPLLLALLASPLAAPARAAEVSVERPWSRPANRGGSGAGYMTLRNGGSAPDRLVSAASPAARVVELHAHRNEGGVMRMRPVPDVPLPPGEAVTLGPGGLHVMLIELERDLRPGDRVPLTLRFERAGEVAVELAVEAMARGQGHHRH